MHHYHSLNIHNKYALIVSGLLGVILFSSSIPLSASSEFFSHAQSLANNGMIQLQSSERGYKLSSTITRAESTKLALTSAGIAKQNCSSMTSYSFSDVSPLIGDLCGYIEGAVGYGIISRSARFYPNIPITRGNFASIIVKAFDVGSPNLIGNPDEGSRYYTDVPGFSSSSSSSSLSSNNPTNQPTDNLSSSNFINRLAITGCINTSLSRFRPSSSISRGEAFKIMNCLVGKKNGANTNQSQDINTNTNNPGTNNLTNQQTNNPSSYLWSTTSYGSCSKTCGGGLQSRTVSCKRSTDNIQVDESYCRATGVMRPLENKLCNNHVCGTTTTVVNGSCNTSTNFACTTGTSSNNNAGSCGGSATWTCNGTNEGTNVSCSKLNTACTVIPISSSTPQTIPSSCFGRNVIQRIADNGINQTPHGTDRYSVQKNTMYIVRFKTEDSGYIAFNNNIIDADHQITAFISKDPCNYDWAYERMLRLNSTITSEFYLPVLTDSEASKYLITENAKKQVSWSYFLYNKTNDRKKYYLEPNTYYYLHIINAPASVKNNSELSATPDTILNQTNRSLLIRIDNLKGKGEAKLLENSTGASLSPEQNGVAGSPNISVNSTINLSNTPSITLTNAYPTIYEFYTVDFNGCTSSQYVCPGTHPTKLRCEDHPGGDVIICSK